MPDRLDAFRKYRKTASCYSDRFERLLEDARRRNIGLLQLKSGETVTDAGCGTGFSFPMIEEGIGPEGRLVAIEQSPDMMNFAAERVKKAGWRNVTLLSSSVEETDIPIQADAAIFYTTHDIMRTPRALQNVVGHLKPGARVLAVGLTWGLWWAFLPNLRTFRLAREFTTTLTGYSAPWDQLEHMLSELQVERMRSPSGASAYRALGRK